MSSIDFMDLTSTLTVEQKLVRDTVRSFVDSEILPYIGQWASDGVFPTKLISQMGQIGLLGGTLPQAYGCPELDPLTYGLAMQELERGDSGFRSFASVQTSLAMFPIYQFGTEEHRTKYLPKMAAGELVGCFGLTEADGGSNPSAMRTRAVKDGSDWVLNGAKMWITNGNIADLAVVFAKVGDGPKDVRGFIVETDTPGFTANLIKKKISLRASVTSELVFEDCRIPDSQQLPGSEIGLRAALECLTQARFGIAFGAVGAAIACFEEVLEYTRSRAPFGRPLNEYQLTQVRLAEMLTRIVSAQLIAHRLAELKDKGNIRPEQVSLAKRNNVRMALEIAREARHLLGASGITYEFASGRHEVNLISVDTYEGTFDIHSLVLGQSVTGKNAFQ